jgi:hypothetical protein
MAYVGKKSGSSTRKVARKSPKKSAAKKAALKKANAGARKRTSPAAGSESRRATARKGAHAYLPPDGFVRTSSGLLVRLPGEVVPANKIKKGLSDARRQLEDTISDFIRSFGNDYEIAEIELMASFSADGKFLGIGPGGAASITLRIRPSTSGDE